MPVSGSAIIVARTTHCDSISEIFIILLNIIMSARAWNFAGQLVQAVGAAVLIRDYVGEIAFVQSLYLYNGISAMESPCYQL